MINKTCGNCRYGDRNTGLPGNPSGMLRCTDPVMQPHIRTYITSEDIPACRRWEAREPIRHNFRRMIRGIMEKAKKGELP